MATLDSLVKKFGRAGVVREFAVRGYTTPPTKKNPEGLPIGESFIRSAQNVRRGRSSETARKNKAYLERYAKEVDLRKTKAPPGPEVVSAKVPRFPVTVRSIKNPKHPKPFDTIEVGHYPDVDRAGNVEKGWAKKSNVIVDEGALHRVIVAADTRWKGRDVVIKVYGRYWHGRPDSGDPGWETFWAENFYSIKTSGDTAEALLHEVNRDILRDLNGTTDRKERSKIEHGDPKNYDRFPAQSARWATHLSGKTFSRVNWISFELQP